MLVVRPAWGVCVQVTTTNQETGEVGKEPLMTLGKFRCAAPLTRGETCPNAMPHMRLVLHSPGLETKATCTDVNTHPSSGRLHLPAQKHWHDATVEGRLGVEAAPC